LRQLNGNGNKQNLASFIGPLRHQFKRITLARIGIVEIVRIPPEAKEKACMPNNVRRTTQKKNQHNALLAVLVPLSNVTGIYVIRLQ